jgi:hypothetical protein
MGDIVRSFVLFLLLIVVSGIVHGQTYTPNDMFKAAHVDQTTQVPPEKRVVVRYLDFHAYPDNERDQAIRAMKFALNSTSLKTNFVTPVMIHNNTIMRIDLEDLGWDKKSRQDKLTILEKFGVKFDLDNTEKKRIFLDIWETFVLADKFFAVSTPDAKGNVQRGWLDPIIEAEARNISYSSKFILRADWLISRLLLEKQFGGFYSDLLFFPAKEADLYKAFGANIDFVDSNNQLRQGGAVLKSIVALNNRELQLIPSYFGFDEKFIWRTFDINKAGEENKSVIQAFGGTVKHDGREIIGSLPNGLHWYYLADAAGNQVAEVPPDIAQDKRQGPINVRERRVINAYKCISCHGEANGTYPFQDVVLKAIKNPDIALTVISKDKDKALAIKQVLEEYYNSKLGKTIVRQQESYSARVKECNGLESSENSEALVDFIERYIYETVGPQQAANEMGVTLDEAKLYWKNSGNAVASFLLTGEEVPRADWENAFRDVMRSIVYPWENANVKVVK